MQNTVIIAAAASAVLLLAACEETSASGSGAEIVDDSSDGAAEAAEAENGEDGPGENGEAAHGSRDNPLELGTTIEMGDWSLTVTDVDRDATEEVLAQNEFNDPPAEGRQFVMFEVDATYDGPESGTAWTDFSWAIVGADGNTFGSGGSMEDNCGVLPNSLDDTGETFPGGEVSGNVCVAADADQLDGGTIRIEETFSFDDTRAFYALG